MNDNVKLGLLIIFLIPFCAYQGDPARRTCKPVTETERLHREYRDLRIQVEAKIRILEGDTMRGPAPRLMSAGVEQ